MDTPLLLTQIHVKKHVIKKKYKKKNKYLLPYFSAIVIPSLYRSYLFRNAELTEREKITRLCGAFFYGFFISTYLSLCTNTVLKRKMLYYLINCGYDFKSSMKYSSFITSVVVAPIFEEIYKGMGMFLPFVFNQLNEIEDGIIFGADIGNGFATLENIFYGSRIQNRFQSIILILVRQCTSSALHTCTTALVGEGVAQFRVNCKGNYSNSNIETYSRIIFKNLCSAILIHAMHNYSCLSNKTLYSLIAQIVAYCYKLYKLRQRIIRYDTS